MVGRSPNPPEERMSWGFTVTGTDKEKLKEHCRQELTRYHQDEKTKEALTKVADAHALLIDVHQVTKGRAIRVASNGHIDTSNTSQHTCRIDITNYEPLV
jgi:hypothetical protein